MTAAAGAGPWLLGFLGWLGSILLVFCGVPLLLGSRQSDRAFLWLWLGGEVCLLVYVLLGSHDPALLLNYGFNSGLVALVLWRRRGRP